MDAFDAKNNNFDELRLFAALLVLWSHSYPLSGNGNHEFLLKLTGGMDTGGGLGVAIFFAISGFLVTKSVLTRSTTEYFLSRAIRILPALLVVTLLEMLLLGPVFTNLSLFDYFQNSATTAHLYNVTIFRLNLGLPGVFEGLPAPSVNGSLWTLPIECGYYIILPIVLTFGFLGKRSALIFLSSIILSYSISVSVFGLNWNNQGPQIWHGASAYYAMKYACIFLVGSCFWIWRSAIPINGGLALTCLAALYATTNAASGPLAYVICIPYLVIYLSVVRIIPVSLGKRFGDVSYGTYIYAFPVQQCVLATLGATISPTKLSLIATPIVLFLAWISWIFVEKPALSIVRGRKTPIGFDATCLGERVELRPQTDEAGKNTGTI